MSKVVTQHNTKTTLLACWISKFNVTTFVIVVGKKREIKCKNVSTDLDIQRLYTVQDEMESHRLRRFFFANLAQLSLDSKNGTWYIYIYIYIYIYWLTLLA